MHRSPIANSKTLNALVMRPPSARTSSPVLSQDEQDNRTLRRLIADQPMNPPRSSSAVSLKSMVVDGRWKFREEDYDRRQLKSMGIAHLVDICHEIMQETYQSTQIRAKAPSQTDAFQLVKLNRFKRLTDSERNILRREKVLELMNIVAEATSTSASISHLVRIWREASEHRSTKRSEPRPLMSYETAFEHLIRTPDDQLLQIALHASLLSTHNERDLRRLGRKLGVGGDRFDMESIRRSNQAFRDFIQILRKQRKEKKRNEQRIDMTILPYERKEKRGLFANVSATKSPLVCQAIDVAGFELSPIADFTANLLWSDTLVSMDIVTALKPYQRVNHFPGLNEISRKDSFAKNYQRLSSLLPKEYDFSPKTWIFPDQYNLWHLYATNQVKINSPVYILKPTNSAMSEGIAIHCDYKQIQSLENYIVQEYIREPLLLDGFKFDLRMYALITSCDPLRVFIFNNGLVRLCSKKYAVPTSKNAMNLAMHLTTYRTNDDDDDFNLDQGKTRTLEYLFRYLEEQKQDVEKLRKEIDNMVLKSIFLAEPYLFTSYRKCRLGTLRSNESVCFELLGFDILIDKNFKPRIIEINRCPNFDVANQIEFHVKMKLLLDTFNLLHFNISDRKNSQRIEKLEAEHRLFTQLGRSPPTDQLTTLKENLSVLRAKRKREEYEKEHSGDFIRLFPDKTDESMNLLSKCFEVLYHNTPNDPSWKTRYSTEMNERELIDAIGQFERDHPLPVSPKRSPRSRSPSNQVSTQTPSDITRSISLSSGKTAKRLRTSTGIVSRPRAESQRSMPGISASRITEKKAYTTEIERENSPRQSPKSERSNEKSQLVTYATIIRETRRQQEQHPKKNISKELQLTDKDFHRLHLLIFDEMCKFNIHYPNKSDRDTQRIFIEIFDHWDNYKTPIGQFWLGELDTDKRESVINIVWTNLQEIMKKICLIEDLIDQLPLNRQFLKLKRRLLSNHGQPFWDACLDRHSSWESLFIRSTKSISLLELDCCYRFVDLSKQALVIVYCYSKQVLQGLTIEK